MNDKKINTEPLVSIIINNYNYGSFLKEAIDSALQQNYRNIEVIVVDDGSTDNSRDVIESYGDQIKAILKPNGGQASAFNVGFKESHGDIVCFLDADDIFNENKVKECVAFLVKKMMTNPLVMVYHLMEVVAQDGCSLHRYEPRKLWNCEPNLYEHAKKYHFFPYPGAPTSGDIFSRKLLELILPIPERGVEYQADNLVVRAAALLGEVYGINQVLGKYRFHGHNRWYGTEINLESFRNFALLRDSFLNKKLKEYGKESVVSLFDSMSAKHYYKRMGNYKEMMKLALRVIRYNISIETIGFFIKTNIQYYLSLLNIRV
ncbi:MAG: glycosyltransferase [Symploca sp. SIO3E6]|nr:glycosyltransferase [Caldora sp. SIO3E6]